jgi:GGDEF domain-containing protein
MGDDASRRRDQLLFDLVNNLENSLRLHETLVELDGRLRRLIRYDAMACWMPREGRLAAAYASGDEAKFLCGLEIPAVPQAAERVAAAARGGGLRSSLAVSLESGAEFVGALALYHREAGAFHRADLDLLQAARPRISAAIANAARLERTERLAAVNQENSLSNRALFLRLDAEVARARRDRSTLAVLVCEAGNSAAPWQAIGGGLQRICREGDCVARMGDAFVLMLRGFELPHLAEKRKTIERLMAGHGIAAKIGAAFYPEDGSDADDLLALAGERRSRNSE